MTTFWQRLSSDFRANRTLRQIKGAVNGLSSRRAAIERELADAYFAVGAEAEQSGAAGTSPARLEVARLRDALAQARAAQADADAIARSLNAAIAALGRTILESGKMPLVPGPQWRRAQGLVQSLREIDAQTRGLWQQAEAARPGARRFASSSIVAACLAAIIVGGGYFLLRGGPPEKTGPTPISKPPTSGERGGLEGLKPAEAIAEKSIGPGGGRVEAAGAMTVDFSPGALEREQKVTIRRADAAASPDGQFYFVEFPDEGKPLPAAARVSMTLPPGNDGSGVCALQQVDGKVWIVVPSQYDPATRTLSADVTHFSGVGWQKWVVGTVVVGTVVIVGGWAIGGAAFVATVNGLGVVKGAGLMASFLAGGFFSGDAISTFYKRYYELGLHQALDIPGFRICWANAADSKAHGIETRGLGTIFFDKNTGQVLHMMGGPRGIYKYDNPNADYVEAPFEIVLLAWELQAIRGFYMKAGYSTPGHTLVLAHRGLGSNDKGEMNHAEWDSHLWQGNEVGILHIHAGELGEAKKKDRLASLTHEFWHAVCTNNGYNPPEHCWWEDSATTAFESEIFPESDNFDDERKWRMVASGLGSGLLVPGNEEGGAAEDPVKRGYYLYPFFKWLIHKRGHDEARTLIAKLTSWSDADQKYLEGLFMDFVPSLLTTDAALADPETQNPDIFAALRGNPTKVYTAWSKLDLEEMCLMQNATTFVRLGETEMNWCYDPRMLHKVAGGRPLSFNVLRVKLEPPQGKPLPPLIVRRKTFDPAERLLALRPTGTRLGGLRPAADCVQGAGAVVVNGQWLTQGDHVMPLVLACGIPPQTQAAPPQNNLLVYYLAPPTITEVRNIADNPEWVELEYEEALPCGLDVTAMKRSDAYSEYVLSGWDAKGQEASFMTLPVLADDAPPWTLPENKEIKLVAKGDKRILTLPRMLLLDPTEIGMYGVDKVVKKPDGKPLQGPPGRIPNPLKEADLVMPEVGFRLEVPYTYRISGTNRYAGQSFDDTLRWERQTQEAVWHGTTFMQSWPIPDGDERITLTLDKGATKIVSVKISGAIDKPGKKVDNSFTFTNIPRRFTADLGPEGPAIYIFVLKGKELAQYLSASVAESHGEDVEYDEKTREPKTVTFGCSLQSVKWENSSLLVMASTMTMEQVREKIRQGKVNPDDLEKKYSDQIDKFMRELDEK